MFVVCSAGHQAKHDVIVGGKEKLGKWGGGETGEEDDCVVLHNTTLHSSTLHLHCFPRFPSFPSFPSFMLTHHQLMIADDDSSSAYDR